MDEEEDDYEDGDGVDADTVIIDNGTSVTKAGFVGDESPRAIFPSIIARHKQPAIQVGMAQKNSWVGSEPYSLQYSPERLGLVVKDLIKQGVVIDDWDGMHDLWKYTFYSELRVEPARFSVLLTESILNSNENREKMAEIMFEKLKVPSLCIAMQSVLALYSNGNVNANGNANGNENDNDEKKENNEMGMNNNDNGIVVSSGYDITNIVPIYDGKVIVNGASKIECGSFHIQKYLAVELGMQYQKSDKEIVRDICEKYSYVKYDKNENDEKEEKMKERAKKIQYELPDGSIIDTTDEIVSNCGEILFNPKKYNAFDTDENTIGIAQSIVKSINKCDAKIQPQLYENIVLTGGNTMMDGMDKRLYQEVCKLAPKDTKINVIAPKSRKYGAFVGASIVAKAPVFQDRWITAKEYEENGTKIANTKCF